MRIPPKIHRLIARFEASVSAVAALEEQGEDWGPRYRGRVVTRQEAHAELLREISKLCKEEQ